MSFTVDYTQGATGPGQITFTLDGNPTTVTASGRLDAVGNRVVSPEIPVLSRTVQVECIRTSSDAMRVVVVFPVVGGSDYLDAAPIERVIENVPLNFTS